MSASTPSTKMNPAVKTQWLSALRSGRYAQGTGFLHPNKKQYCCLGVLCTVAEVNGVGAWQEVPVNEDENPIEEIAYNGATELLPESVISFAGLEFEQDDILVRLTTDQADRAVANGKAAAIKMFDGLPHAELSTLNDAGFTFAEIADIIEEQL